MGGMAPVFERLTVCRRVLVIQFAFVNHKDGLSIPDAVRNGIIHK